MTALNTFAVYASGAVVEESAEIGDGTSIGANAWIGSGVTLGQRCWIKPGVVIGGDGFGYERDEEDHWVLRQHDHGVRLGDDVHVGSNTCIDRGRHRDTIVGAGTKIDNLVHVAHNVLIGVDCIVVALAEVSGSAVIGNGCWIGPHACIRQGLTIGEGAMVGMGAVVTKDVPPGMVVVGNPARVLRERRPEDG